MVAEVAAQNSDATHQLIIHLWQRFRFSTATWHTYLPRRC
jgi:hypothetical protein